MQPWGSGGRRDIRHGSPLHLGKIDLALFYEGNLSDGSGVARPSISFAPFRYCTLTFAPCISYGGDETEFVSLFGRFSLSMKLTLGTGYF